MKPPKIFPAAKIDGPFCRRIKLCIHRQIMFGRKTEEQLRLDCRKRVAKYWAKSGAYYPDELEWQKYDRSVERAKHFAYMHGQVNHPENLGYRRYKSDIGLE